MSSITEAAQAFFDACDAGKGWEVCSAYCTPDATFTAQAEPLMEVKNAPAIDRLDEGPDDSTNGR